jgi:hypothetical protein
MSANTELVKEVSRSEDLIYGVTQVGTEAVQVCGPVSSDATGKLQRGLLIYADSGNSATVYVGGPTVSTATGMPIKPDRFLEMPIDDPSKIYLISSDTDQSVRWIGV